MKFYAGIGARNTPPEALDLMSRAAEYLQVEGWHLRSGHAPGADQAFEKTAGSYAEVFLPWPAFERFTPIEARHIYHEPTGEAMQVAAKYHPAWDRLGPAVRRLHARNAHIILGRDLDDPVRFVMCWTPNGRITGGTGQALRIALAHDITCINLGEETTRRRVEVYLAHVVGGDLGDDSLAFAMPPTQD